MDWRIADRTATLVVLRAGGDSLSEDMSQCRFRSSLGGVQRCQDPAYEEGFCRFHYQCLLRGEILFNGQINEALSDQNRRRWINFHGLAPDAAVNQDED